MSSVGRSKVHEITAVTFRNGHSSAEVLNVLNLNSKLHAAYALGIECKHDVFKMLRFRANTDAAVTCDTIRPLGTAARALAKMFRTEVEGGRREGQDSPISRSKTTPRR